MQTMSGRVMTWGTAAGLLVTCATALLLFWASPAAAPVAGGLFLASLGTSLLFLFRTLVGGDELRGERTASRAERPRA